MLASGPIGQAKDMTIRSRKGSMGGLVTYRTNILIHSKYKELIELDLYLSEKLLKIFVEQRLEFRETCQWRIISHRSQRFFPVDIKREKTEMKQIEFAKQNMSSSTYLLTNIGTRSKVSVSSV